MSKLLIIGGNGQVGFCLNEQCKEKSIDALVTTRELLDVTNFEQLKSLALNEKPSVIINASAYTNVEKAEDEPENANAVNATAVGNMAKVAHELNIPLIHISTDYVFDGSKTTIYEETDPTNPLNAYGKSKLLGEEEIVKNHDKYVILRTSWVFGQHGKNFVKTMLRLLSVKEKLSVIFDQVGGPTYAGDIAQAILTIVEKLKQDPSLKPWGIYNFAGFPNISWCEFARNIYAVAQEKDLISNKLEIIPVPTSAYPTKATRPLNSQLSLRKIKEVFNIAPSDWAKELKENLEKYIES